MIGLSYRGPYQEINRAYADLGPELAMHDLWRWSQGMAAVYLDDPSLVPAADLRAFAGVIIDAEAPCPAPLEEVAIAGGAYAVMTFVGPYTGLAAAYDWLFGDWLEESGIALREAPAWEQYLNTPMDTAPDALKTLIFLPMEG